MSVTAEPSVRFTNNDEKPVGHGRMLRKEDPRLIRGMGHYVDDIQLPGMLHMAILRAPMAHAKITSIDVSVAQAHPKVRAVITGADMAEQNLAWMPTLSNDVQAVLATDKVRFQGQEVAFVVADDRYAAATHLNLSTSNTNRSIRWSTRGEHSIRTRQWSETIWTVNRTTIVLTGKPGTRTPPSRHLTVPMWSPFKTSYIRACIPRRWRHAAVSLIMNGSRAISIYGLRRKLRMRIARCMRW